MREYLPLLVAGAIVGVFSLAFLIAYGIIRKQKEAEAAIEAEIIEKIRKESNKRVSAPRAISAVGSDLKLRVVKDSGEKVDAKEIEAKAAEAKKNNKGTTNPKNQSGKSKNKNKKNKGKKKK